MNFILKFVRAISIFAIAIMVASPYNVAAFSVFNTSTQDVLVAPYNRTYDVGAANWKGYTTNSTRSFLNLGHQDRVQQSGTVTKVEFHTVDASTVSGFYVNIWRDNGSSYDLIGTSENLAPSLVSGSTEIYTLASPISGVQEGDYIGYVIEHGATVADSFHAGTTTGLDTRYINSAVTSPYDWESSPLNLNNIGLNIGVYVSETPQAVFIGDSIIAGHPAHYTFIESNGGVDIDSTIQKQFSDLTSYTYQNMGIGSQTTASISARFQADVLDKNPELVVLEGGVNDIAGGSVTEAQFLTNYTSMLDAAQTNGARVLVMGILPWTNGSNAQMDTRDTWNASLETLVDGYSNARYVNLDSYVGVNRTSGPANNLWDINSSYDVDGVHFNTAGHGRIAQGLANALLPELVIDSTSVSGNELTISYVLSQFGDNTQHSFNQSATAGIEYSIDGGVTWSDASDAGGSSEGFSGLSASQTGESHVFVWDAGTDIGTTGSYTNVKLRMNPTDADNDEGDEWVETGILSIDIDLDAPSAPTIVNIDGDTAAPYATNSSTPAIVFSAENGSTVTISGHTCAPTPVSGGQTTCTADSAVADGSVSITPTIVDGSGNTTTGSAITFTVDTSTPINPTVNTPTDGTSVSGTAEPGTTVTVTTPSGSTCTVVADTNGDWECEMTPEPSIGDTLTITTTDEAGNASSITQVVESTKKSSGSSRLRKVCKDKTATNYNAFPGVHTASLCKYETQQAPSNSPLVEQIIAILSDDTIVNKQEAIIALVTPQSVITQNSCPATQQLTQNMKAGDRNGKYSSWQQGAIVEVKILQQHMNRLGFNAGAVDGILGPITDSAIKRMQTSLGVTADGYVGPQTRRAINNSC